MPVTSVAYTRQVLAELAVTSAAEDTGSAFIEGLPGVSVWGSIETQNDGSWSPVLVAHDCESPYTATFAAIAGLVS